MKIFIDESGAIQIPEDIRSWLGIQPGDLVELFVEDSEIVIYPQSKDLKDEGSE